MRANYAAIYTATSPNKSRAPTRLHGSGDASVFIHCGWTHTAGKFSYEKSPSVMRFVDGNCLLFILWDQSRLTCVFPSFSGYKNTTYPQLRTPFYFWDSSQIGRRVSPVDVVLKLSHKKKITQHVAYPYRTRAGFIWLATSRYLGLEIRR